MTEVEVVDVFAAVLAEGGRAEEGDGAAGARQQEDQGQRPHQERLIDYLQIRGCSGVDS